VVFRFGTSAFTVVQPSLCTKATHVDSSIYLRPAKTKQQYPLQFNVNAFEVVVVQKTVVILILRSILDNTTTIYFVQVDVDFVALITMDTSMWNIHLN
jgi:predicted ATP-grasp superfamily ATP-dependent carboligase